MLCQVAVLLLAVRLALVFAFLSFAPRKIRARLFRCRERAFRGECSPEKARDARGEGVSEKRKNFVFACSAHCIIVVKWNIMRCVLEPFITLASVTVIYTIQHVKMATRVQP